MNTVISNFSSVHHTFWRKLSFSESIPSDDVHSYIQYIHADSVSCSRGKKSPLLKTFSNNIILFNLRSILQGLMILRLDFLFQSSLFYRKKIVKYFLIQPEVKIYSIFSSLKATPQSLVALCDIALFAAVSRVNFFPCAYMKAFTLFFKQSYCLDKG